MDMRHLIPTDWRDKEPIQNKTVSHYGTILRYSFQARCAKAPTRKSISKRTLGDTNLRDG